LNEVLYATRVGHHQDSGLQIGFGQVAAGEAGADQFGIAQHGAGQRKLRHIVEAEVGMYAATSAVNPFPVGVQALLQLGDIGGTVAGDRVRHR